MALSILVRAPNWLGDSVMSLPFFASLRCQETEVNITCLCRRNLVPLFENVSAVDHVLPLDESSRLFGTVALFRNAATIRSRYFDLAFSLPPSFGSAWMLWKAGIPRRVGHAADRRKIFLTDSIPYGGNGRRPHRSEGYLQLLDCVWPTGERQSHLHFNPGDQARCEVDRHWPEDSNHLPRPVLAVGPGSVKPNGMWMPERFQSLCRRWLNQSGGSIVLLGTRDQYRLCEAVRVDLETERVRVFAGEGDVAFAAEVLRRADLFVGNDSGLAHLSAAVGTPTIVISGPGDPAEVAPYSPLATTVKTPVYCSPCYRNTCHRTDIPLECLHLVSVDDVWTQMEKVCATTMDLKSILHKETDQI